MLKPLLIGQAPGPNTDPDYPLYPAPRTSAGGRLCEMMGLSRGEYITTFDRVNLLPYFPGKDRANEDKFPMSPARLAAQVLRPMLRGRRVILVGRQVAQAFQVEADWLEWVDFRAGPRHAALGCDGLAQVAVVPPPLGAITGITMSSIGLVPGASGRCSSRNLQTPTEMSCLFLLADL